jgi:hypothetical protein
MPKRTDMKVGLRVPLQAEVERDGTVVLTARFMLEVAVIQPQLARPGRSHGA